LTVGKGISIVIDGVEIQAEPGETIMNAADAAGIYIPRLCHHDGLAPHGSCRLCTVRVNGRPQAACTTPVAPGMIVENDRSDLNELRRQLIEMLFVEGNHFCMFCEKSGNCELQALAYRFEIFVPRYPYLHPKREVDASHPEFLIDHNRCILCARCVRASRVKEEKIEMGFVGRGSSKRLSAIEIGEGAASVCPVGALLEKRIGYAVPVGRRKYDMRPIGTDIEQKAGDKGGRHE
jgi:[NiFe] hydrogenase diaphorase moiety small subunit